jgi:hypothetical protein
MNTISRIWKHTNLITVEQIGISKVSGIIITELNSVLYYQCVASTARRPITDAAYDRTK